MNGWLKLLCTPAVRMGSGLTEDFEVKVGVHQGAVSAESFALYHRYAGSD